MTLREVLQKTMEIVGEIELITDSKEKSRLIASANMVYHELISQYAPLRHTESVEFNDGKAYYSSFSKKVKDVLSVERGGRRQFKVYPLYVECAGGKASVTYLYYPDDPGLDDELVLPPQYTPYTLSLGIAAEYLYRSGLTDEAMFYKNRYDTALLNLSRRVRSVNIKAGGGL